MNTFWFNLISKQISYLQSYIHKPEVEQYILYHIKICYPVGSTGTVCYRYRKIPEECFLVPCSLHIFQINQSDNRSTWSLNNFTPTWWMFLMESLISGTIWRVHEQVIFNIWIRYSMNQYCTATVLWLQ